MWTWIPEQYRGIQQYVKFLRFLGSLSCIRVETEVVTARDGETLIGSVHSHSHLGEPYIRISSLQPQEAGWSVGVSLNDGPTKISNIWPTHSQLPNYTVFRTFCVVHISLGSRWIECYQCERGGEFSPKDVTNKRKRCIYYHGTYRPSGLEICVILFTHMLHNRGVYMKKLLGT